MPGADYLPHAFNTAYLFLYDDVNLILRSLLAPLQLNHLASLKMIEARLYSQHLIRAFRNSFNLNPELSPSHILLRIELFNLRHPINTAVLWVKFWSQAEQCCNYLSALLRCKLASRSLFTMAELDALGIKAKWNQKKLQEVAKSFLWRCN